MEVMCWIRRRLKSLFFIRHFCFREGGGKLWGREHYGSVCGKNGRIECTLREMKKEGSKECKYV